MIVLDELFTLHGFELCSEILFEVELPRVNSQGWNCPGRNTLDEIVQTWSGFSLSGLELFRMNWLGGIILGNCLTTTILHRTVGRNCLG